MVRKSLMITGQWSCYNTCCLVSVDFRLGTDMVWTATAENAANHDRYYGGSALRLSPLRSDRTIQTLRDWRVIYSLSA